MNTRDFINVGIFTALYIAVVMLTGMVELAGPAFMFVGILIGILANGVVVALYASRVPKFGALTLLALITSILFVAFGNWWAMLILAPLLGLAADAILTAMKNFPLAYGVFSIWLVIGWLPVIFNSEEFWADVAERMNPEYADSISAVLNGPVLLIWAIGMFIVGVLGGLLGQRLSHRNFQRAGLA